MTSVFRDGTLSRWILARLRGVLLLPLAVWGISTTLAQERADFPVNNAHLVYHDVKTDARS